MKRGQQELTCTVLYFQIWDLFEGGHLFTGHDLEHQKYRSRAHLAEITALLGQPPKSVLKSGHSSHKFYTNEGQSSTLRFVVRTIFFRADQLGLCCRKSPPRYSCPRYYATQEQRNKPGRGRPGDFSCYDAEDAPVGAFEALLCKRTRQR